MLRVDEVKEDNTHTSMEALLLETGKSGPRDVPSARFIENVEEFLNGKNAQEVERALTTLHSKFLFMERSLQAQCARVLQQKPDIEHGLESVSILRKKEGFGMHYTLSDGIYGKARVREASEQQKVFLWMGANVLLENSLDEAEQLLTDNLQTAVRLSDDLQDALNYLKEQVVTTELNISRVHNYGVGLAAQDVTK